MAEGMSQSLGAKPSNFSGLSQAAHSEMLTRFLVLSAAPNKKIKKSIFLSELGKCSLFIFLLGFSPERLQLQGTVLRMIRNRCMC